MSNKTKGKGIILREQKGQNDSVEVSVTIHTYLPNLFPIYFQFFNFLKIKIILFCSEREKP